MSNATMVRGIAVPVGIVLLAFAFFITIGGRGGLGPIDTDAVRWIFVVLWTAAPVIGGVLSRDLDDRQLAIAFRSVAVILGVPLAALLLGAAGGTGPECAVRAAGNGRLDYWIGALVVVVIVAIGMGAAVVLTARLARRGPWPVAAVAGAAFTFVVSATAYLLYYSVVVCLAG